MPNFIPFFCSSPPELSRIKQQKQLPEQSLQTQTDRQPSGVPKTPEAKVPLRTPSGLNFVAESSRLTRLLQDTQRHLECVVSPNLEQLPVKGALSTGPAGSPFSSPTGALIGSLVGHDVDSRDDCDERDSSSSGAGNVWIFLVLSAKYMSVCL